MAQGVEGATIDYNRVRTAVSKSMEIRGGVREKMMGDCVTVVNPTKAEKSKHLEVGPLDVSEIVNHKHDMPTAEHEFGAAYVMKADYGKVLCFSGKQLRYAENEFVNPIVRQLHMGMDHTFDRAVINAACGAMHVGDECDMETVNPECCIEHGDQGITPEKITEAVTLLQDMNNGSAQPIIPITRQMYRQLTQFVEFTNNDFLLNGQKSVYSGVMMRSMTWFDSIFKIVSDRTMRNLRKHTCWQVPTLKAEPYVVDGKVQKDVYIRHIPVFDKSAIYWEPGMATSVDFEEVSMARRKPKGFSELRIQGDWGLGRVNNCGVVILKVLEKNKLLRCV